MAGLFPTRWRHVSQALQVPVGLMPPCTRLQRLEPAGVLLLLLMLQLEHVQRLGVRDPCEIEAAVLLFASLAAFLDLQALARL